MALTDEYLIAERRVETRLSDDGRPLEALFPQERLQRLRERRRLGGQIGEGRLQIRGFQQFELLSVVPDFAALVPIFIVKNRIETQFVQNGELLFRDLRRNLVGIPVEIDLAGSQQPHPLYELLDRDAS